MSKHKLTVVVVMSLVVLLMAGCGKKEDNQKVEEKVVPVQTDIARKGDISEEIKLNGSIAAQKEINIIASMGGKVSKVSVQVGQAVKKGAALVTLDSSEIERQLKQAQEGVKSAEAGLKVSEITIEPVREAFINAQENYDQTKEMSDQGLVNAETLKATEDLLAQARLAYIQATGDPEAPKNLRKTSMQAEMSVKQANSSVEALKAQLENTRFTSPIKGLVAQANVSVGNLATPSVPMVKVIDIDKVVLKVNIPEARVSELEKGQVIAIEIDSIKETFNGKITSISPQADQMTKDFPVEITIENNAHLIKPGMTASAKIPIEEKNNVVLIPKEAILNKDGIEKVFVVEDAEKAVEKSVKTGLRNNESIEIITGLKEGAVIIVKGQHSLKDNGKVKITN